MFYLLCENFSADANIAILLRQDLQEITENRLIGFNNNLVFLFQLIGFFISALVL
jgi:hypothetical protein